MGNCLVTKLKESVNNDNLIRLGKVTLLYNKLTTSGYNQLNIAVIDGTSPVNIKVTRGTSHLKAGGTGYADATDLGTEYQFDSETERVLYITPDNNAVVEIDNISNIKYLRLNFDESTNYLMKLNNKDSIHSLSGLQSLNLGTCNEAVSTIINLVNPSTLTDLMVHSTNISGNLSDFATLTNLEKLYIQECKNLGGEIKDLGNLINLKTCPFYSNNNISGRLEDFVIAQRAARVAAGLNPANSTGINFVWLHSTGVTFNGQLIDIGSTPTLTWTANSMRLKNSESYDVTVNE